MVQLIKDAGEKENIRSEDLEKKRGNGIQNTNVGVFDGSKETFPSIQEKAESKNTVELTF